MMRSTFCRSAPGPYTMPFHVPATAPMSDTGTGLAGLRLAQPTSETANPTTTAAVHSHRDPLGIIATHLLLGVDQLARSTSAIVPSIARTRSPPRFGRSTFLDLPTGAGSLLWCRTLRPI